MLLTKMNFADLDESNGNTGKESNRTRRVILWSRDDLLAWTIDQILESGSTWDVIRVSSTDVVEILLRETEMLNPEVVILCQEKGEDNSALPLNLIENHPGLRVVSIDMVSNLVQVYSKCSVVLQSVTDFLSIVNGSYLLKGKITKEVES